MVKIKKNVNEIIVVYDMDDVLWPLNEHACSLTGIDYGKLCQYSLGDNPLLTKDEVKKLSQMYTNVDLWRDLKWERGAKSIHKLQDCGVKVMINSNCLSEEVASFKRSFVGRDLKLPEPQIVLNVTTNWRKKKMIDNTFIFVEDSPHNIEKSNAKYTIIIDKPWNREVELKNNMFRVYSLQEANRLVKKLIQKEVQCV